MNILSKKPKSKAETIAADQWVGGALYVSRVPAGMDMMRNYDFNAAFTAERLKNVRKEADRGIVLANLGEFKNVIKQAEDIHSLYKDYLKGKKHKEGFFSKAKEVTPEWLTTEFTKLIQVCEKWQDAFTRSGTRKEGGKEADQPRKVKLSACRDFISGATIAINSLKFEEKKESDPAFAKALARCDELRTAIEEQERDAGVADSDLVDEFRSMDATILSEVCGKKRPKLGTSEVYLINAPDGSIAYAFKTVDGESDQTGMARGCGAVREVMMSKMCQASGMDFGWPKASMGRIKDDKDQVKVGVLIDGIKGEEVADKETLSRIEDPAENAEVKQKSVELLSRIPPREIQMVALCNLALTQFDIKFGNVLFEDTEDGLKGHPYDAGAAMPSNESLVYFAHVMKRQPGQQLLIDSDEQLLPSAAEPLNGKLCQEFLKIDLKAMLAAAEAEMTHLAKSYQLDAGKLGVTEGLDASIKSIQGIQAILGKAESLGADGDLKLSLDQFLAAYQKQVLDGLVKERLPDWEKKVRADYAKLSPRYPGLIPDADKISPEDMAAKFLQSDQQALLDVIQKNGGVDLLKKYGVAHPIFYLRNTLGVLRSNKAFKQDKVTYGNLFPPKKDEDEKG